MEVEEEGLEAEADFSLPLLADPSGLVNTLFEFAALSLESGVTVEVVPVAIIDTKLLVAVPATAWHRQSARRALPSEGFSKMVPVDVLQCSIADRSTPAENCMRVWMGFMDPGLAASMFSADDVECLDYQFLSGALPGYLPYATGLVDAAQEHFAFLSAEEVQPPMVEVAGDGSGSGLESRMAQMELAVEKMSVAMQGLLEVQAPTKPRVSFSPTVDRPPAMKSRAANKQVEKYPDLDASVVTAALAAGVSEGALQEMQKLIGVGLPNAKKLQEPALGASPKPMPKRNVLSESETDEEEEEVDDGGSRAASSMPAVARSIKQLTKIVSALALEKRRKSQVSRVEAALDGISSMGLTESGTLGSGKKAATARRVLRSSLLEAPEEIYQLVERYMMEDLSLATQTPGQPAPTLSARAWIEHRSKIGSYKTSAHCAWSAGGVLDALIAGNTALARARASLLVLMLDQTAVDRGSWALSAELSLEPPPPMSVLAMHSPPNPNDGEAPFSRLLDARWAEVHVLGTPKRSGGISESEGQARKERDGGGHGITKSKRQSEGKGCGKQRKHGLSDKAATMGQPEGPVDASTKMAHVLGSRAPTIAVAPFLNSWPRLLLRSGGALGEFLQSVLNIVPENRDDSTGCGSTWPIPMPYPEAFRSSGTGSMWRKKRLCLQVLVPNWFWLGEPSKCPDILWLGRRLSARQWKIVSTLENLAEDANSLLEVDAMGMGRTAGKIELQDNDLAAIHRACDSLRGYGTGPVSHPCSVHGEPGYEEEDYDGVHGVFVGTAPGSSYVAAKPIVADRLQFGPEPRFDPAPYLDVVTAEMYENPRSFSDFKAANPPVGRVRGACGEIKELYKKLALTKRLVPLKSERVDSRFTSGLFAVVKDLERDRLIMDSRPANAAEEGLNKWTQCAASAFNVGQVEIRPGEILVMSGQDIKDFYYQFRIGPERSARNALSGKMSRDELAEIFGAKVQIPEEGGLGDICACEFAQGSHLGLLLQAGAIRPPELLRYRSPSPRSCFSVGVVIDDLVMLERVLEAGSCGPTTSEVRMGRAEQAYRRAGLPTNPKKAFYKETAASFWGISVDGVKGTMRPNPQRLWPLELITWRVVTLGLVTTSLLESLVGSWVSVFMQRRRMLSVLDLCFRAIHSGAAPDHVLRMSPALKDELVSCCVLGTMTVSNLRAAMLPMMKATDASDWGMAAAEASIPVEIAREAARFSLTKSMWSKLLPPSKAWLKVKKMISAAEEMPGGEAYNTHPFWSVLANYPKYEELWRRPYERVCHINIGELAAHLKEEARVGSHHPSSRCCYGLDSQVALGALIKGRSASAGLNALLRRSLAICLGYDLYGAYGYFPSAINRSDGPTRGVPPAPPSIKEPYFWKTLAKGECGQFEEWMNAMGVPDTEAACIAEFAPLGAEQAISDEEAPTAGRAENMDKEEKLTRQGESGPPVEELDAAEVELSDEAVRLLNLVPSKFVWWPTGASRRFTKPGALDLYSGTAGVARHLLKMGCPFVVVVDWKMGSEADLLRKDVQQLALDLVVHKAVEVAGSALICSSFSKAITPAVRSPRFPRGLPGMRRSMRLKVSQGNAHSDFNATLVVVAEERKVGFGFGWRIPILPTYGFSVGMLDSGGPTVIGFTGQIFAGLAPSGGRGHVWQLPCQHCVGGECYAGATLPGIFSCGVNIHH